MISKKRIFKELPDLLEKYKNISVHLDKTNNNYHITIHIAPFTFRFILVSNEYPFKSPKLTVNNISYKEWYRPSSSNPNIHNLIYKKENKCPCCNTILCHWSAAATLNQIIEEFFKWRSQYLHAYNLLYIKKKISQLYPIYNPEDIINNIAEFILE